MDQQDLINQLMMQTMVQQQPSFLGVQAPQDPTQMKALLQKLQAQQAVQQASAPSGGEWGFLRDAGRGAFAQVGQGLGDAVNGALAPPPDPNAPPSPQIVQQQAVAAARSQYQKLIAAGVPENTARQAASKMMVQAGLPNAGDALEKANQQGLADQEKISQAGKQASQDKMDADELRHRVVEEDQKNQEIALSKARLALDSSKAADKADADDIERDPSPAEALIIKKMASGEIPMANPASRAKNAAFYAANAIKVNPDLTAATYPARQAAYKAIGSGKDATTLRSFNVVYDHMSTAQDAIDALHNGDMPAFNHLTNVLAVQTGRPAPTNLQTGLQMIKGEIVKGVTASVAGVEDRKKALAGVTENSSPEQLSGSLGMAKNLILGQVGGFKRQYSQPTSLGPDKFNALLDPRVRTDLEAKEAREAAAPPTRPGQQAPAAASSGWGKATVVGQ